MLIIERKSGSGIITSYSGDGIFDFGKILLKKALNSNLVKKASQAINSDLGQKTISAVKAAAQSELGQSLKRKAISEVKKRALDASNKALDKISIPDSVKKAAKSELGQELQKKIISEVGKKTQTFSNELGLPVEHLTQSAFQRLGIAEPPKKRRRVASKPKKVQKTRGRKGRGFVYPQQLVSQFGGGIVLE